MGVGGGGKGLSMPSHSAQKTSEMSANESAGFENRESLMKDPFSLIHPNCTEGVFSPQEKIPLNDKYQRNL